MRLAALITALLFACISASAQKCELTLAQSPELRGLKLGMSVGKAGARLVGVAIAKPNNLGIQTVELPAAVLKRIDPTASADVRHGSLIFFDGRLMWIKIVYDDSLEWKSADEFAFNVSQALGLPPVWPRRRTPYDDDYLDRYAYRTLECVGFKVTVSLVPRPRSRSREAIIDLTDDTFETLAVERAKEVEERKKSAFKP